MTGAANQSIMTIIPKEALAVLLTPTKDDRTFWSTQLGSPLESTEPNAPTTRGSVLTSSSQGAASALTSYAPLMVPC